MNIRMYIYILGKVLLIEGALMVLPIICGLFYGENQIVYYIACAVIYMAIGYLISMKKPKNMIVFIKDGCIATALSWVVLSIAGCIPFMLTKEIPSFTDAMFETASGFSTTGASILTDVEALSHVSLFWRSLTHWIGGMGVLVFLIAIVPMSGGSNINLMRAESPGPSVGKLVPKIRQTARILYTIYFGLTIAEFIFLVCGQMPVFDAICSSVGTAGTGGFGIKNDSITSYSAGIQWIVTVFMILFGVNFNAFYFILLGKVKQFFKVEEVRWYIAIILIAGGICAVAAENGAEPIAVKSAFLDVTKYLLASATVGIYQSTCLPVGRFGKVFKYA